METGAGLCFDKALSPSALDRWSGSHLGVLPVQGVLLYSGITPGQVQHGLHVLTLWHHDTNPTVDSSWKTV